MKKYLIKEITTATETNKNFKGETRIYYIGKGGIPTDRHEFLKYYFNEYGFSTKAAVSKALKHHSESVNWFNNEYKTWTSVFEVIEMDV
jgi:hypothetical protein